LQLYQLPRRRSCVKAEDVGLESAARKGEPILTKENGSNSRITEKRELRRQKVRRGETREEKEKATSRRLCVGFPSLKKTKKRYEDRGWTDEIVGLSTNERWRRFENFSWLGELERGLLCAARYLVETMGQTTHTRRADLQDSSSLRKEKVGKRYHCGGLKRGAS